MAFSRKFNVGELELEYCFHSSRSDEEHSSSRSDEEHSSSRSDEEHWITITCTDAKGKEHALFKTICDIAGIDAIDFYSRYVDINMICDKRHEISFYMATMGEKLYDDDDDFVFDITEEHELWQRFNCNEEWSIFEKDTNGSKEPYLDDFIELFRSKFAENIDFHINKDELPLRPVLMMKLIKDHHVVIKEATVEEINEFVREINNDPDNYEDRINYKLAHINRTEEVPYLEYDLIDGEFDEYREWPYRTPLVDLVLQDCLCDEINYDQPFKISFYSFLYPEQGASGMYSVINLLQYINDNKLSIDMVHDLDDEKRILVKISRNELEEIIRSVDYSGIRYHSDRFGVYDGDKVTLRERIVEKLMPYKVTNYEIAEYDQENFEESKKSLGKYLPMW